MAYPRELKEAAVLAHKEFSTIAKKKKKALLACIIRRNDGTVVSSRNGHVPNCVVTPSIHAEARASRKADVGSVAYVSRVTRDGNYALARPCPSCQILMRARGVAMVYYTVSNEEWGCLELSR